MATYANNLRLTEITTGDESGTWGTTTNNNWEFTTAALGYGVKNMAADADQTFTMTDGTADTLRSMYLKITSTITPLTATRTLTIAPNTVSKVWIIENATSGSQSIIIKQGSGATVTIATATKAMVYTDGAGGTAAVFLASPTISTLAGTVPVANGGTSLTTLTANNVILGNGASAPTFVAPSSSGNVLTSNGTTWASSAPAAGGITYTVTKTANYTAVANDGVLTNTTGGAFTVNLPASPTNGQQVIIADAGGTWGTNNLTVGRNGNYIADVAQDLVCDISGVSVQFVYNSSGTATWEVYAQVGGNGGTVVTLDGVQTLTNKTINLTSNTLVATSAQMAAAVTDETGSGALVFATSPTLVTPALGTPSSGTLSSCTVDGTDAVGFRNIPISSKSAAYTTVLADSGKVIFHPSTDANARTFTIDSNANVAYPLGTALTFINMTSQVVTIAITTDTMYLSSAGTTGSRSLAQYGSATAIKMTSTTWLISGSGLT